MKRALGRQQRATIVYGVLGLVLITVVMQLSLLAATMNAYLGGDEPAIWPATLASLGCCTFNAALLRYLYGIDGADH